MDFVVATECSLICGPASSNANVDRDQIVDEERAQGSLRCVWEDMKC